VLRFFGTVVTACAALGAGCTFDTSGTSALDDAGLAKPDASDAPDADTPPAIDAGPAADAPTGATPDAAPPACADGYTFVPATGSWYRVGASLAGWYGGESSCEDDGPGAHLAIADDATEAATLAGLASPFRTWIGITDTIEEDTFVTVTGVFPTFTPWKQGEPNNGVLFGEDCVTLDADGYNDDGCGSLHAFVCECDGVPVDPESYD
jgi:hypothetical protein